jgi:5-methylcytosine-specific restriction endonuclease McrA
MAADKLKRDPKTNARMIAQVCDLLDAAAWLAGIPLLALVAVRNESGEINPKAWIQEPAIRNKIIDQSVSYKFTDYDFAAIAKSLEELAGLGNHAAWALARQRKSTDQFFRSFTEPAALSDDAIEDLGTDTPTRTSVSTVSYSRDQRIRAEVMRRARGRCELCGKLGFVRWDDTHYLESHHIIALANDGADRLTNVIALCPGHHREAHFGKHQDELEQKMVLKVKALEAARKKNGQTVHLKNSSLTV